MGSNALASGNSSWSMHISPVGRFAPTGGDVEPRRQTLVDVGTSPRRSYDGVDTASEDRLRECPINTFGDPRASLCGTGSDAGNDNAQLARISLLEAECASVRNRYKLLRKHAMMLELQKMDHIQQVTQLQLKVCGLESELTMLRAAREASSDTNPGGMAVSPLPRVLTSHERERGAAERHPIVEARPAEAAARGAAVLDREQSLPGGWAVDDASAHSNETSQAEGRISDFTLQQNPGPRLSAESLAKFCRATGVHGAVEGIDGRPQHLPTSPHAEGNMDERISRLQASPRSEDSSPTRSVPRRSCSRSGDESIPLSPMHVQRRMGDESIPLSPLHVPRVTRARVLESRERPAAVVGQTELSKTSSSTRTHGGAATTSEDVKPPPSHPLHDFWADSSSSSQPKQLGAKAGKSVITAPSPTAAPTSPCPSGRPQRSDLPLLSENSGGCSSGDTQGKARAPAVKLEISDVLESCSAAGSAAITQPSSGNPPSDMGSNTDPASLEDGRGLTQTPTEDNEAFASSKTCAPALPCEIYLSATAVATAERKPLTTLRWAEEKGVEVESRLSHVSFCAYCSKTPSSSMPIALCGGCPRIFCENCVNQGLEGNGSLAMEGLASSTRALLQGRKGDFYIMECPRCLDESDGEISPPPKEVPPMTHLLEELLRHDLSLSFRAPMDIAEHPTFLESGGRTSLMDLGLMMSKLQNRKYPRRRGPGQFMEDLRRIWRNCRRIGGCDELGQPKSGTTVSGVVRCALVLEAMSEKFFAAHMADQGETVWPESAWDCYRQRKQQAFTEARLKRLERREIVLTAPSHPGEEPAAGAVSDGDALTAGDRMDVSGSAAGSVRDAGVGVERAQRRRASTGMAEGGRKRPRTVPGTSTEGCSVRPSSANALPQLNSKLLDELCDVAIEFTPECVTKL